VQHRVLTKAFENRLVLSPLVFKTGDNVLESAAGTGIWALEFFAKNFNDNVILNVECIDITDKQFPRDLDLPANIHFSINSILDLPPHWSNTFVYAHQRLLICAMNKTGWPLAISELFRALKPGGWLELVEFKANNLEFDVGPNTAKLHALLDRLYAETGIIGDLDVYLPRLLEKTGFLEIHCESRSIPIRRSAADEVDYSQRFYELYMGMKGPALMGHGYGVIKTSKEYDTLLEGCLEEWRDSQDARATYFTIIARKPDAL